MKELTIYDAASNSLKIHDVTDDTIGYEVSIPVQGLDFPSTRVSTISRAGEYGAYIPSTFYGERRLTLEGIIYPTTGATIEERRIALEKILRYERDTNGFPQKKTIKFTTQDDTELQFEAVIGRPLKMDIVTPGAARFLIDFVGDYVVEAQTATSQEFSSPEGGGFILPVILPITFTADTGSTFTETNNGNAEAYPTVTFTGPLTNPRMENSTVGRSLGLTYSVPDGSSVVIDMREKTIIENGTANRISNKTSASQWWWLDPGDNDIFFASSDGDDLGSATLEYRDSYLGV